MQHGKTSSVYKAHALQLKNHATDWQRASPESFMGY